MAVETAELVGRQGPLPDPHLVHAAHPWVAVEGRGVVGVDAELPAGRREVGRAGDRLGELEAAVDEELDEGGGHDQGDVGGGARREGARATDHVDAGLGAGVALVVVRVADLDLPLARDPAEVELVARIAGVDHLEDGVVVGQIVGLDPGLEGEAGAGILDPEVDAVGAAGLAQLDGIARGRCDAGHGREDGGECKKW